MDRQYLPLHNDNEGFGFTNNVLVSQAKNQIQLFLPAYLRSKLKNIVALDVSTGIGLMNSVVILSIYYDKLNLVFPGILKTLQENIILRLKIDPPLKLEEGFITYTDKQGQQRSTYITKKVDEKENLITFTIRKMFSVNLVSHVFWSPFQYIQFVNTIAVDTIVVKDFDKNIKINFNLMDFNKQDKFSVVSYTDEGALGQFDLATSLISAQFSNQRFYSKDIQNQIQNKSSDKPPKSNQTQEQSQSLIKKIQSFSFGHAIYPVYRRPLVPLFNIFFPVIILGFINLGIFFQESSLGKIIINIASLLVSYLYFLPIVRQKIPPSSSLTITQIILFSMASLTLLTYYHSISVRDINGYHFIWNKQIFFIIALIGTLLIIAILCTIGLVFGFVLLPSYNSNQKRKEQKFDRNLWSNVNCDEYFQKIRDSGIQMVELQNYDKKHEQQQSKQKSRKQ